MRGRMLAVDREEVLGGARRRWSLRQKAGRRKSQGGVWSGQGINDDKTLLVAGILGQIWQTHTATSKKRLVAAADE